MTLTIALMPLTYRGGAEAAHPHAFFQFWLAGDDAAHHHHDPESTHADHDPRHDASDLGPQTAGGVMALAIDAADSPRFDSAGSGRQRPAEDRDLPTVSAITGMGGAGSVLPTALPRPLPAAEPAHIRWQPAWIVAAPVGRTSAPEPPPPRSSATSR